MHVPVLLGKLKGSHATEQRHQNDVHPYKGHLTMTQSPTRLLEVKIAEPKGPVADMESFGLFLSPDSFVLQVQLHLDEPE